MSPASPLRTATCSCGALRLACEGDPVRLSMCHCQACQRRTGAPFSAQARYPRERITVEGDSRTWSRTGESGSTATFHFCPTCGSTVFWETPGHVSVAVGAFADPGFPPPQHSVWEEFRHPWVSPPEGAERMA